jgi:hypothetical protein
MIRTLHNALSNTFAADELRRCLQLGQAADVQLIDRADADITLRLEPTADDRDGFAIRRHAGRIVITGTNERSVLFGVYEFLERTFDACFSLDGDILPNRPRSTETLECDIAETAAFAIREIRLEWSFSPQMIDWIAKQRFNAVTADVWFWDKPEAADVLAAIRQRGLILGASGHAMFHFLAAEKYFAARPEWFPFVDGQRRATRHTGDNFCYSNAHAVEAFLAEVEAFLQRFPDMRRVSFWQGDGGYLCQCDACREKPFMTLYTDVIAKLRSRLSVTHPHVHIGQLAYNFDQKDRQLTSFCVPTQADPTPTMFAYWGQNLATPLFQNTDPTHRLAAEYITEFATRAPGRASIFSYHTDTYMNSNLCPLFDAAQPADFRDFKRLGIDELCLLWIPWDELNADRTAWLARKNGALWARLAMDLDLDVHAFRRRELVAAYDDSHAVTAEMLWSKLNAALVKLCPLTSAIYVQRMSDAWGCGFCREVLKWTPTTDLGPATQSRIDTFTAVADELAPLVAPAKNLAAGGGVEAGRLADYILHCAARTAGLSAIFHAQSAIQKGQWGVAIGFLRAALATDMADERKQTAEWLARCENALQTGHLL